MLKLVGILVCTGIFGAYLSKRINQGSLPIWWTIIPSLITGFTWGNMVKKHNNLSYLSALFDVVYTAAYVLGFVILGDRLTPMQIVGFIISMIGVALMSI